jgi:hypothetical protein
MAQSENVPFKPAPSCGACGRSMSLKDMGFAYCVNLNCVMVGKQIAVVPLRRKRATIVHYFQAALTSQKEKP